MGQEAAGARVAEGLIRNLDFFFVLPGLLLLVYSCGAGVAKRKSDPHAGMAIGEVMVVGPRDVNGYPKPEIRWVKTLLDHEYDDF